MVLRKILFPISLLYAAVVRVRNLLFDIGVFTSKSFKTPILCIGNLSVGGTGKTPMAEFLISVLQNEYKVAVLSRGYRRKSKGFVLATENSTVEQLGDEPFQMHCKFPEVTIAVDANRRRGIAILEEKSKPDIILLDDAFQHRKVKAGLSILLTAHDKLYSEDWCLPTGNLRDNRREAKRADVIVVTKCPLNLSKVEQNQLKDRLKPLKHQHVLFAFLDYDPEIKGMSKSRSLDSFANEKITLVTGIADPQPLVSFLDANGISFEHMPFNDHHFFTDKELQLLNSKNIILTTEKDYVRLKERVDRLYYISIKHAFLQEGETVLKRVVKAIMKQNS